jgi:two-component system response regulator FixJ
MTGQADAKSARVVIVDDDEAIRDSLSVLLETRGFAVDAFASGPELLTAYEPSWQGCVMLDVRMPVMDGLDVLKELMQRSCKMPVIIMTAHGDVPLAVRAMKAGAVDFLEKPIEPEALLSAVHVALKHGPNQPRPAGDESIAVLEQRFRELTPREREVLTCLVRGQSNKLIAYELDISPRTVEMHRARVMQKMEAQSLSQLVRMALALGVNPD